MSETAANWFIDPPIELRALLALALGFLIGIERQRSIATKNNPSVHAGVRTFSIVAFCGFAAAVLHSNGVAFAIPASLLGIIAMAVMQYNAKLAEGRHGWTTESAVLLTFLIGCLCFFSSPWIPLTLGIVGTLVLSEKSRIEQHLAFLDQTEFLAVLKFSIITLIILPILPDKEFTRFAINPFYLWKLVVLVSAVGFVGYFLVKKLGPKTGWWLSGLAGGFVSSTAVAISAGRAAAADPLQSQAALRAALLASSVMYIRLLTFIVGVNPAATGELFWKFIALAAIGFVFSLTIRQAAADTAEAHPSSPGNLTNPFEIGPALAFAVTFLVITIVTVFVREYLGASGLVGLAALVGLTDITAFILSLAKDSPVPMHRMILVALIVAMAVNTLVKGVYFAALSKQPLRKTMPRFVIWTLLHAPFCFL